MAVLLLLACVVVTVVIIERARYIERLLIEQAQQIADIANELKRRSE